MTKKKKKKKKKKGGGGNFFGGGGGGGGGGANKVHYGRCASGVLWVYGITFHGTKNIRQMIRIVNWVFLNIEEANK